MSNNKSRRRLLNVELWLSKRSMEFTSLHVACMTLGPKKRNIDKNPKILKILRSLEVEMGVLSSSIKKTEVNSV